jgi:hypothetical protein
MRANPLDPISNADKILLVLRQRLEDRAKSGRRNNLGSAPASTRGSPMLSVRAVAAAGTATDRQLRRLVIQGLLADQFGGALLNEAKFQGVIDQVTDAICADEAASQLLSQVISELAVGPNPT